MGGAVALDFTLTYPDAVAKLVLIDSTGYTNAPELVKFLIPPLDRLGVVYLRWRKLVALQLTRLVGGDSRLPPRILKIEKPTLILWGEADEVLGTEDASKFAETIVHSQLVWIANAGPTPHIEQPEVTAQQILSFSPPCQQ